MALVNYYTLDEETGEYVLTEGGDFIELESPFPHLEYREDSKKNGYSLEDVGMRAEMEGGYVLTAPRHTRKPRRTYTTGFTDISNDQKIEFETFFTSKGTYASFYYISPIDKIPVLVRFKSVPDFKYAGFGSNYRWDINSIVLEEV